MTSISNTNLENIADSEKKLNNCLNCNAAFEGNFCSNCGEKKYLNRINGKEVWEMLQYALFHFNNKIFSTIYELAKRPGETTRNYIQGKRAKYFSPTSLLAFSITIYFFLDKTLDKICHSSFVNTDSNDEYFGIFDYIKEHTLYFSLVLLPAMTFITFWLFKKQGYNFFEVFVMHAFQNSQAWQFRIVMLPFIYLFKFYGLDIEYIILLCIAIVNIRFSYFFFNRFKSVQKIIYILISMTIYYIIIVFLFLVITKILQKNV